MLKNYGESNAILLRCVFSWDLYVMKDWERSDSEGAAMEKARPPLDFDWSEEPGCRT